MSLFPGNIVTMNSLDQGRTAHFASPKHVFVLMLLGEASKGSQSQFDPGAALRALGWYPESDFGPVEPSTGSLEDRAAELAASMKVMAALHRANEDVAAADEFAKGAGLVLELMACVEADRADAERWRIGVAVNHDTEFTAAMDPLMSWTDGEKAPETEEEANAWVDRCIKTAREAGLWPRKQKLELTEEARDDRDSFENTYGPEGNCSCHLNPPCGSCTHPGNPANQEDDSACWTVPK